MKLNSNGNCRFGAVASWAVLTSPNLLQVCLELQFILEELLGGCPIVTTLDEAERFDGVFYLEYDLDNHLCEQIVSRGKKLIIYHLGDETAIKDLSAYSLGRHVFRCYYHEQIFENTLFAKNITWVPNGYRNGLRRVNGYAVKSSSRRNSLASFVGWLSNDNSINNERHEFSKAANSCGGLINCIPTQGFAGGYSANLYGYILENSIFAPCPAGNAAETIRLFDALELGCIPISIKHPFLKNAGCMPEPPFPLINHWSDLPSLLLSFHHAYTLNDHSFDVLQSRCLDYWKLLKQSYRTRLRLLSV